MNDSIYTFRAPTLFLWARIIDSLIEISIDAGVTVDDISRLVRARSVRIAERKMLTENGRTSKSQIAIMTGISRSEVARLLKHGEAVSEETPRQSAATRVLDAWRKSPSLRSAKGNPAILDIFGKRRSFENLVRRNGGGIPVRAMLDQFSRSGAVRVLRGQRVMLLAPIPADSVHSSKITEIGERVANLIGALRNNLDKPQKPVFDGTALVEGIHEDALPIIRKTIAELGAKLIYSANAQMSKSKTKSKNSADSNMTLYRVGLTSHYFENPMQKLRSASNTDLRPRKNLRRREHGTRQ